MFSNPNGQNINNQEYLRFQFADPVALQAIELAMVTQGLVNNGGQWRVDASNDGTNWIDLSGSISVSGPGSGPGVLSGATFAENFSFSNTTEYTYYRIYGLSGTTINWYLTEAYFELAPLLICDTDGDGISNHLDLDSDGDGCYDAFEANVTGSTNDGSATDSLIATTNAEVGLNGFANSIETNEDGVPTYTSTYYAADNNLINACADSDGDGVGDLVDIDDDNDLSLIHI